MGYNLLRNGIYWGYNPIYSPFTNFLRHSSRWWFPIFFIFTPTQSNDPLWLAPIFFKMGWLKPPTRKTFYSRLVTNRRRRFLEGYHGGPINHRHYSARWEVDPTGSDVQQRLNSRNFPPLGDDPSDDSSVIFPSRVRQLQQLHFPSNVAPWSWGEETGGTQLPFDTSILFINGASLFLGWIYATVRGLFWVKKTCLCAAGVCLSPLCSESWRMVLGYNMA